MAYCTEWWYQLCAGLATHYRTESLPPGWSWMRRMYWWVSKFWSCTGLPSPSLIAQSHGESVWPSSRKQASSRALSPDSSNYWPLNTHHCITRKLMERGKWKSKRKGWWESHGRILSEHLKPCLKIMWELQFLGHRLHTFLCILHPLIKKYYNSLQAL